MNLFNLLATALSLQLQALRGDGAGGLRCHHPHHHHHSSPQPFATRVAASLRALRMQFVDEDEGGTQHFRGALYGVTATVALHMRTREAKVELRGVPLGGSLSGGGWLKDLDGDAGEVELDAALAAKLAWRLVRIRSAALDRRTNTMTVAIVLPLLGEQALALKRVHPTESFKT